MCVSAITVTETAYLIQTFRRHIFSVLALHKYSVIHFLEWTKHANPLGLR